MDDRTYPAFCKEHNCKYLKEINAKDEVIAAMALQAEKVIKERDDAIEKNKNLEAVLKNSKGVY